MSRKKPRVDDKPEITNEEPGSAITKVFMKVVNCKTVRLRESASVDGKILTVLAVDTEVLVDLSYYDDDFYKVETVDGKTGYIMKIFLVSKEV